MIVSVVPVANRVFEAARWLAASFILALAVVTVALGQDASPDAPAAPLTTVAFNSPGTFQWTAPAGVTSVQVQVWGGGGSGGNAQGQFVFPITFQGIAGGGGGGAYSRSTVNVTPGTAYTVVVGLGGNQGPGGVSSFGSGMVSAAGGAPGGSAFASGGTQIGASGPGGSPSGSGTVKFQGGSGAPGDTDGTNESGGGGSSAGTGANGNSGAPSLGGIAPPGGGNGGNGVADGFGPTVPQAGVAPGGGGGGALATTTNFMVGAQGAAGRVVIVYPPTFTASGRIITPQGRGIRGAIVTVTGNGLATPVVVHAGRYGNYTVPNLPLGTYTFTYSARRFTFTPPARTVSSPDGNVSVADVVSN